MSPLLLVASAWAASVSMSVGVPRLAVGQGTSVTVTLVGGAPIAVPELPVIDGVRLVYVTRSQQFVSTIESGVVQTYRFTFEATCLAPGEHLLGPARVSMRSDALESGPVVLVCTEQAAALPSEPLVATAAFDRPQVWEGEVVLYRAEMIAQTSIRDVQFDFPEFVGLQVLGQAEELTSRIRDPSGDITVVRAVVPLLASGTGDRAQPPSVARVAVLLRGSSPFGLPQARVKHVPTQTAPLTVRPLPPAPPGFSGLVGDFTLTAQLGKTTVGVGESVPLTVEIVGTGSVDGFQLELPEIPDAQVYRDASTDQARLEQGRYLASKRFTNVLVPTRPGELRLPALEVVVFSPTAGEYVTLTTDPGVMQVSGQDVSVDMRTFGQTGASGDGPKPIELVEIYTWGPSVTPPLAPLAPLGLALVGLPGLLVLGLDGRDGLRRWWSGRRVRRVVAVRGRGRLRGLPPEPGARLAVLDLALREVLADRVKTTVAHLRRDEALAALEDEEAGPVRDAFAALDRARFAGGEVPDDAVDRVKAAFDALGAP